MSRWLDALRHQRRHRPRRARPYRDAVGSRDNAVTPRFPVVIGLLSRHISRSRLGCCRDALPGLNKGCRGALPVTMDCSVLVSAVAVLPQGLSYAASIGLAGAFWRVFPERCLRGSGGGSPRTGLCCFYSSACCSVLSDGLCSLVVGVVHSSEGSSQDRPLSLLAEVLPRSALCSFWATVVLPLWFEVCRSVGLLLVRFSQDGSWRFLAEVLPKAAFLLGRLQSRRCALGRASGCCVGQLVSLFVSKFSRPHWWDCVSPWLGWFASFPTPYVLSQMVV
ncbi:hypothetical protein Taro_016185 [Colocasia esculenta]|uniref:Uncharacterized protein n=1 Tax=Colocasia esculenta TaxID=4460 RepID=A0A843UJX9_COLES|nr:hypothetical protein [Colocasia esculenta]